MAQRRDDELWALAHAERASLGEVVVHAQDIRQPLGLGRTPSIDALTPVADFFARRNFTVASRTRAADLQLRAANRRTP